MKTLISITGGTCSGKSFFVSEIQKQKNIPLILSTTSRKPRLGEVSGIDYHFTSKDSFEQLISNNALIEYVQYNNNYYGITEEEFNTKLKDDSVAMIILESVGVKAFEQICADKNIRLIKIFIDSELSIQKERFITRAVTSLISNNTEDNIKILLSRFESMLTKECNWKNDNTYFCIDGTQDPLENFKRIENEIMLQ